MVDKAKKEAKVEKPAAPKPTGKVTEPHLMNIYQKIAAITGEVATIAKDGQNTEQKYKFIEYAAVAGELRGLFAKYGVVVVPNMPPVAEQHREELTSSYGKKGVNVLIDFKFDIVNADQPDDRFAVGWTGEAADYGDKATNKAATAALKYYLMRQFNISEKGEQEADNSTIDRGAAPKQVRELPRQKPAEPRGDVTTRPDVPMITLDQQDALSELLSTKGMYDSADQKALVLKMANVDDVIKITYASADAILNKIEKGDIAGMYKFIGKVQPTIDESDIDETDDDGDQPHVDETPPAEGDDAGILDVNPPQPNEPVVAPPPKQVGLLPPVDDKFKAAVKASLDALGLQAVDRMRLLKDSTGAITPNNLTDEQWRTFSDAVDEYAINMGDEVTADETPVEKNDYEGNENTNDGGEVNELTDTNDADAQAGDAAAEPQA